MLNPNQPLKGATPPIPNVTLTPEEQRKILEEFNITHWSYLTQQTLISQFDKQVLLHPEHIAVCYGEQQLTYQQLDQKSNQLAHHLAGNHVGPGTRIAIWLDRSVEWLIAVIGVLKTGAAYVPIDPAYPVNRAAYIIADAGATTVITDKAYGTLIEQATEVTLFYIDQLSTIAHLPVSQPATHTDYREAAYVIYTSGSTGKPKGVVVTHHSIEHLVTWHNNTFEVTSSSRLTLVAGLAFDISVWETWSALTAGATLFIANNDERINALTLSDYYLRNGITHGFTPTALAPGVVEYTRQLSGLNLKFLFTGGEQLKPVSTTDLSYELIDYYGPTECSVYATYRKVKEKDGHFISSIGRPIANTQAYILNAQLELVPIGAVGELCISGIALAKGYLNNEALTNSKFIPHPFQPGERLYMTGDLARWLPDGSIQFLGRIDTQVKIRGFRVELGEIEQALLNISGIRYASVIPKDNASHHKYLVAFIVPEKGISTTDIPEVRQRLKRELPGYMIPAQIISIKEIPLTENGKVNRSNLAEIAEKYLQEIFAAEPPINETEQVIADIWSEALGRPGINRTDNFFDIGGDSLLVAVVATRLQEKTGIKVYMRDIYQYPVLQELAAILSTRTLASTLPEEDIEPYIELKNDVYLAPGTVITGGFDPESLQHPTALLLTGATGFIGIHLLHELLHTTHADIYCLVRAQDEFHAMEKIDQCFAAYHITGIEAVHHRIIPVAGDFSKPFLGLQEQQFSFLSQNIDVIYHSGSSVNFIEPYSYMKAPNVDGLREIIRLAGAGKTKCLVLLSTISVYSWGHVFTNKTVMLETDDITQNLLAVSKDIGYVRSKWVMEAIADLAAQKGLPVITYRLGYAMCHSITGASAPYQWWAGLVKNCIELKSYPLLKELREGLITVDYMTKAIAYISKNKDAIGLKFNLIARPETNLTLEDFFELLQQHYPFTLKGLPYKTWRRQWEDDSKNRLFPLTSLFKDNMHEGLSTVELYQHTYIWDCAHVTRFLNGSGIEEPVFDKQILDAYLKFMGLLQ
ncbi:amino acid adenylation domain-containing protein [Chitinophaga sp. 30R24]|uniref:non-ribosomal peptide synthetase family protein n=1 Tax=Chitinophaga sp. 30R24 TaxID=3248838 RepID=UPI003B8F6C77